MHLRKNSFVSTFLLAVTSSQAPAYAQQAEEVRRQLLEAQNGTITLLEDARQEIRSSVPLHEALEQASIDAASKEAASDIGAKLAATEDILKQTTEQQQKIAVQMDNLFDIGVLLEEKNDALIDEKNEILRQKAEIETREKLFSMGFYASLTTTIIAILGIVLRMPTVKLERKLKMLEIKEKELAIANAVAISEKDKPL